MILEERPKLQSKRGPRGRENIEFSERQRRRRKEKVAGVGGIDFMLLNWHAIMKFSICSDKFFFGSKRKF